MLETLSSKAIGIILLGLSLCAAAGQTSPEPNPGPVQAEFLNYISVRHLANGQTIFARVTLEWHGPNCDLRTGATLSAKVEISESRKGRSPSRLALSFTKAQCNGAELKPMNLLLAAVAGPPEDWRNVPDSVFKMPVMFMKPDGMPGFGGAGIGGFSLSHLELKGIIHHFPMSPKVQPGDVLDIRGIKLDLATGPNGSSVLSGKKRDVSLDKFTQFLLVPTALVKTYAAPVIVPPERLAAADTNSLTSSAPAPPPPVNDFAVCAPPGCAVDLPVIPNQPEGHNVEAIALRPLGYVSRSREILADFDNEEALAWLGPSQLLFAFNPHSLIHRTHTPDSDTTQRVRRVIRAVLFNAESRTATRAVDWEITDMGRYLWTLDASHILVHVGSELRIYKTNLEFERSFPLVGSLAFVRIAPNGKMMAVATLRERHSRELHAQLHEHLGRDPEEDVDVAIIDRKFNTIARASTVSEFMPPTLLNEGQVNLLSQPNMHYRLALNTWDDKTITLARFTSRCTPELSSVAPDLLFLLTCDVATHATVYRVLRADGKLLLRREAGPRELGQEIIGNHGTGLFAIKVARGFKDLLPGMQFRVADLESEEVRVYSVVDGKRLLTVNSNEPVASYDSFALSPDGAQLAVLSQSKIQLFSVAAR